MGWKEKCVNVCIWCRKDRCRPTPEYEFSHRKQECTKGKREKEYWEKVQSGRDEGEKRVYMSSYFLKGETPFNTCRRAGKFFPPIRQWQ